MPLAAAGAIHTAESRVQPWDPQPELQSCLNPGSAAPRCGEGGEADGLLHSGARSFSFCWDAEGALPTSPTPRAGSSPLPQAAFAISPELWDSCHFTFFSTYRLGKQQEVREDTEEQEDLGGYRTGDQQSPMEDFAFSLQRCFSAHRGCLWQNSLCFHGIQP